jgi:hypothetical protein
LTWRQIAGGKLPGAVVMVARKGRIIYSDAIGFQDKGANTPMKVDSIFRVYSMTKPLASVAALARAACAFPRQRALPHLVFHQRVVHARHDLHDFLAGPGIHGVHRQLVDDAWRSRAQVEALELIL